MRTKLYRWSFWFFFVNFIVGLGLFFSYWTLLLQHTVFSFFFFIFSSITQCILFLLPGFLIVLMGVAFFPKKYLVFPLAILMGTVFSFGLLADRITFHMYHFHYAKLGWEVWRAGAMSQVMSLAEPEKIALYAGTLIIFLLEALIGWIIWQLIVHRPLKRISLGVLSVITLSFIVSYGMMSAATLYAARTTLFNETQHTILQVARIVPYFSDLYAYFFPQSEWVRYFNTHQGELPIQLTSPAQKPLQYPLHPLIFGASPKMNIIFIALDTWRYDTMTARITPNIYQFAQQSIEFKNHWSGGNCTGPGIFSLFYGLPAPYWPSFLNQEKGPLFLHQLLKNNYQMGIFASAPLEFPAFNKTIFSELKKITLNTPGDTTIARDNAITLQFKKFLAHRNQNQPFFSFLFYDAIHNYCDTAPSKTPFQPAIEKCDRLSLTKNTDRIPYWNRYLNAVYFVDNEVGKVISLLKEKNLLANTIVIITGDHGEQLNDARDGVWVHASDYTSYQLHVPFIVHWPQAKPRKIAYFTSHEDITPTLMQDALNCLNPITDYSVGLSLFSQKDRPFLISGSYGDYAVLNHQLITRVYPDGDYTLNYLDKPILPRAKLNQLQMQQVYQILNRYYVKKSL